MARLDTLVYALVTTNGLWSLATAALAAQRRRRLLPWVGAGLVLGPIAVVILLLARKGKTAGAAQPVSERQATRDRAQLLGWALLGFGVLAGVLSLIGYGFTVNVRQQRELFILAAAGVAMVVTGHLLLRSPGS